LDREQVKADAFSTVKERGKSGRKGKREGDRKDEGNKRQINRCLVRQTKIQTGRQT
jgi:hypothetical protein